MPIEGTSSLTLGEYKQPEPKECFGGESASVIWFPKNVTEPLTVEIVAQNFLLMRLEALTSTAFAPDDLVDQMGVLRCLFLGTMMQLGQGKRCPKKCLKFEMVPGRRTRRIDCTVENQGGTAIDTDGGGQ